MRSAIVPSMMPRQDVDSEDPSPAVRLMYRTHGAVTALGPNQVFVFGSNLQGFHGAGSAGFAMRGDSADSWRDDARFLKAMPAPAGSADRIGKWAVYGIGEGFQEGTEAKSYAVPTVTRPGARRSISLSRILESRIRLGEFASAHPEWDFVCCVSGGGRNGYSIAEMRSVCAAWIEEHAPHVNIIMPEEMLSDTV